MNNDDRRSRRNESAPDSPAEARDRKTLRAQRAQLYLEAQEAGKFMAQANAALAGFNEPSPKTIVAYNRLYARIRGGMSLSQFATNIGNYYKSRAAFIYGCCKELQAVVANYDAAMARADWKRALELAEQGERLLADLERYPPDRDRQRCRERDFCGEYRQLAGDQPRARPKTKRRGLASLPADWRSQVVGTADQAHSKYALPIAVQLITGCRPAEVERGVLARCAADGSVVFRISGAKVKPGVQGQEWREVVVTVDRTPEALFVKHAIEEAKSAGVSDADWPLAGRAPSAKGLGWAVGYYGQGASTRQHSISAYSARHPMASDLKADGASAEACAVALGHLVDRTSQMYGRAAAGRGKRRLTATAARPVKHTRSDPKSLTSLKRRGPTKPN